MWQTLVLVLSVSSFVLGWDGRLVFVEEFDSKLNSSIWDYDESCSEIFGKKNLQCYTRDPENSFIKDGVLNIVAKIENKEDRRYTSARIRQRFPGYTYGTYVVRARFPQGKQLNSQIWLFPIAFNKCKYQEVTFASHKGETNEVSLRSLYGRTKEHSLWSGRNVEHKDPSEQFHEYAVIWTPNRLVYFVDAKPVHDVPFYFESKSGNWSTHDLNYQKPCNGLAGPFSERFGFIFNLAVGGENFYPNESPLRFQEARQWKKANLEIDYVKIYQIHSDYYDFE